jgi:hypothetical protein
MASGVVVRFSAHRLSPTLGPVRYRIRAIGQRDGRTVT